MTSEFKEKRLGKVGRKFGKVGRKTYFRIKK